MKISFNAAESRFIAESRFEEKNSLKAANFRWDPVACKWWTNVKANASRLLAHCDESAKAALSEHVQAVEASKATHADIDVPAPAGLAYLPYQKAGIAYGVAHGNCLIADEPGLGKTIQVLGIVNASPEIKTVLVVCPASLRLNWQREAQKWLARPTRTQVVVNGKDEVVIQDGENLVVVVGYEGLVKRLDLQVARWDLVVLDEAHLVKNPKAQRTRAAIAAAFLASRKICLTGTPILNRPIELQPLLALLAPGTWGDFWKFAFRYCNAHKEQVSRSKTVWNLNGSSNLSELQERLRASVMVRRLKADVLKELPAKRRQVVALDLKAKDDPAAQEFVEEMQEAEALLSYAAEAGDEDMVREGTRRQNAAAGKVSFTAMSAYRHKTGLAKVASAIDYVNTLREGGVDKVIVFAHHHDVISGLVKGFEESLEEGRVVTITGEMDGTARQAAVDAFQTDDKTKIVVASIMAAGVGLTLTAASTVVFVESDWVPGNLTQAEDRAHRIGQKDMVMVHQLVVPGSLDEYMSRLVTEKQNIADAAMDRSTTVEAPELSLEERAKREALKPTFTVAIEKRQAMLGILRALSSMCDGAVTEDGAGFNKLDSSFGKKLASLSDLSDRQYNAAWKMCRKYRRQVGEMP